MSNIKIQISPLECEAPVIGDTYRNQSTTGNYVFNWTTLADLYESYGLNTEVILWYATNGGTEVKYTATPVPNNAVNFQVSNSDIGNGIYTMFRVEIQVEGGNVCSAESGTIFNDIIIN